MSCCCLMFVGSAACCGFAAPSFHAAESALSVWPHLKPRARLRLRHPVSRLLSNLIWADRMGVRLMGVVFQGFLFVGQVMTALGASYIKVNANAAWYTMFVGRTFFGFGGESLSVVQSAMIASFFQGKELAFALGVNVALARVGSVLNNEISAVIASNAPVALAYWVGVAIIGAGLVSMVAVFYVDLRAENALRASRGLKPLVGRGLLPSLAGLLCCCCVRKASAKGRAAKSGAAAVALDGSANRLLPDADLDRPSTRSMDEAEAEGADGLAEDLGIGGHGPLLPATPMLGRAHAPGAPGHGPGETGRRAGGSVAGGSAAGPGSVAGDLATADDGSGDEIHLGAVLRFPAIFWVLTLSCVTVYIDVLAFNNNASTFITQKFLASAPLWRVCDDVKNGWYLTANTIQSTVYACGAIITPFIGGFTDTYGMRAALNVLAAGAITGVHSVLAFTHFYPALPLVFLGMAYSLYAAALWPCIALVIEAKNQATAYGEWGASSLCDALLASFLLLASAVVLIR